MFPPAVMEVSLLFSLDTCGRMVKSLLLLYLFITRAAADCSRPQGTENIVLTNEALLKNEFPEGSDAMFECANGYEWEAGSGTVTCTSGQWSKPQLNCKKKDCGPPRAQPHMRFVTTDGTLFGASVRVHCEEGYRLTGTSYKQCYATGWSGRAKCEVVNCAKPEEVTNGRNSWVNQTRPIYGNTVQYVCDEGYTLTGNQIITCSGNGKYDLPPPVCNGVTDHLATVDHFLVATASTAPATPTTPRDKIITTSAAPTASPTVRGGILPGPADVLPTEDTISTTTITTTRITADYTPVYTPVIVSVIGTVTVVLVVLFICYRYWKTKGSYDTGEDRKPKEYLQFQFQNL